MKLEKYVLSILKIKDKFVVMSVERSMFGLFTFTRAIANDLSAVYALDCNADEVYNSCGVSKEEEATTILNSYHDYLVCCGKYVEIKQGE